MDNEFPIPVQDQYQRASRQQEQSPSLWLFKLIVKTLEWRPFIKKP
jgi:hypothetical protein